MPSARSMVRAVLLVSCFLPSVSPEPATAQIIVARVLDDATGALISGARVAAMPAGRDTVVAEGIAVDGLVRLVLPEPASYRLRTQMIGYENWTTPAVEVGVDGVVTVELRISAEAIPLEPLRVVATRLEPSFMRDVRYRESLGWGVFLHREDLEPRAGTNLESVLRSMPGVQVERRGATPRTPPVVVTNGGILNGGCPATVYLNGVRQFSTERLTDFFEIPVPDIEAIEVYRYRTEAPGIFTGVDAKCGVVAVWLTTGHEVRTDREPRMRRTVPARIRLGVASYQVAGSESPADATMLQFVADWSVLATLDVGIELGRSRTALGRAAVSSLLRGVDDRDYDVPTGDLPVTLWSAGVEARMGYPRPVRIRPFFASRVFAAHRGFNLNNARLYGETDSFSSLGLGVGLGAGIEAALFGPIFLSAELGRDWMFFEDYDRLAAFYPTNAEWRGTALRVALGYTFDL